MNMHLSNISVGLQILMPYATHGAEIFYQNGYLCVTGTMTVGHHDQVKLNNLGWRLNIDTYSRRAWIIPLTDWS
jgi:hypothetical protein